MSIKVSEKIIDLTREYTVEEYAELAEAGYSYELVEGKLVEMSPSKPDEHGEVAANIHLLLGIFVKTKRLGKTYIAEAGFNLKPTAEKKSVRSPDVAFVSNESLARGVVPKGQFGVGTPDLAIEVISPTDEPAEIKRKVAEYQEAGTPLLWLIYPAKKRVEVYHPGQQAPVILGINDMLSGETVVPGFVVEIKEIFG